LNVSLYLTTETMMMKMMMMMSYSNAVYTCTSMQIGNNPITKLRPYQLYRENTVCSVRQSSWSRHYATSQKITGLIPDEVNAIFN
jgi:hypothetical protein